MDDTCILLFSFRDEASRDKPPMIVRFRCIGEPMKFTSRAETDHQIFATTLETKVRARASLPAGR
jgi:hypothetical protein